MAHSSNPFRAGRAAGLVSLLAAAVWAIAPVSADDKRPVAGAEPPRVTLSHPTGQARVDVLVDGKPFTSYIWPGDAEEADALPDPQRRGRRSLTRGFPPAAGERADHPHHVGLWFNYGDVNGYDFWNHSERDHRSGAAARRWAASSTRRSRKMDERPRPRRARRADPLGHGAERHGAASTRRPRFTFRATADGLRVIDRATYLTAAGQDVDFTDNKEGMLGLRVRRALEDPAEKGGEFVDAAGKVTKMAALDSTGVTGVYTSSEGKTGGKVWGTRGKWTTLAGTVDGRPVTIAILDHPGNPGFPTYWHARGYGLFAANPLGQAVFSEGKEKLNFTLKRGQNQLFRYRVLIADRAITPDGDGDAVPDLDRGSRTMTMHERRMTTHAARRRRAASAPSHCSAAPPWHWRWPPPPQPAAQTAGEPAKAATGAVDAKAIYEAKCQVCHMADGNSQIMPNMSFADGIWKHGSTLKQVQTTITTGVPGTAMVSFKEQLTPAEIAALAKFVRKFDKKLK